MIIPPLHVKDRLTAVGIQATEKYTQRPPRFTEASLVKRMEELGIGRPSTYAPTITTIQNRDYVVKEDRTGKERPFVVLELTGNEVARSIKTEVFGAEKGKLFPTDIGMVVNDFLTGNFEQILDYNFTANVEEELDRIAEGSLEWHEVIDRFYKPFRQNIESVLRKTEKTRGERVLGTDPATGKTVSVKIGRFGPIAQLGESVSGGEGEKPQFASLRPGQLLETIRLEEALELFRMPRNLGEFENEKVTVGIGRFGPYIRHNGQYISLPKGEDPYSVTLEKATILIGARREKDKNAVIRTFDEEPELKILKGRWGPYISYKQENYRIPKGTEIGAITFDDCRKIIDNSVRNPVKRKTGKRKNS
jgi:DNA topoisomerase-1